MCENDGYWKLFVKGLMVIVIGFAAIYYPETLSRWFTHRLFFLLRVYHVVWFLVALLLFKRMIPSMNSKMSSGKVFARNFSHNGGDSERKRQSFLKLKRKTDSGATRSAIYWLLLLLVMWMWRHVGMLPDLWVFVTVLFFVFMDQFCVSIFCPFQWLIGNKCCNTCRINNWGYAMAFSPLIFIPTFWTYSIVFLSAVNVIQWEYLYFRHPQRYSELYNTNLACSKCATHCTRKSRKTD